MKEIDINSIILSPKIEELRKKVVTTTPDNFSEIQKVAITKAVLYIISSDNVITKEEKQFFIQLCADLNVDNSIIEKSVELPDEDMFNALKSVTDAQEAYILFCLTNSAKADNNLTEEEIKMINVFAKNFQNAEKPKDFYAKILTL